jgi:hypothetical protein
MRSLGLLASLTLLAETTLLAQHTTPMPSPPPVVHTTVTAPHTAVITPVAIHTGASAHHGGVPISHTVAPTHHVTTVKANGARISGTNPAPEKHGLFSWLRKHDREDRRKERRNPSSNYLAQQIPPSTALANHKCTTVPFPNPAIPCNPFAPCCD